MAFHKSLVVVTPPSSVLSSPHYPFPLTSNTSFFPTLYEMFPLARPSAMNPFYLSQPLHTLWVKHTVLKISSYDLCIRQMHNLCFLNLDSPTKYTIVQYQSIFSHEFHFSLELNNFSIVCIAHFH